MSSTPVSWLVSNWRLKLLALVLALALLMAVAFSENPIGLKTVQARVYWDNQQSGIALVQPPSRLPVTLFGAADALAKVGDQSVAVRADLSKVTRDGAFTVPVRTVVLAPNVNVQSAQSSLLVNADRQVTITVDKVDVVISNLAPGLSLTSATATCGADKQPCHVSVLGPAKVLTGTVSAQVVIDAPVTVSTTVQNEPIQLLVNGKPLDLIKLYGSDVPRAGMDPATAQDVSINVARGNGSRPVALRPTVTGRPACGFAITGLTITPGNGIVNVSGPLTAVQNVSDSLPLGTVDVSGATGNVVANQSVATPSGITADPSQVTVTVLIARQFDCTAPTPTPPPSPGPPATPTPTPR